MMIILQTASDLKEIIATNNATATGILIAISLAFSGVIVYLFKQNQSLQEKHMNELRSFNETLLKLNNSYNEFTRNVLDYKK